MGSMADMSMFKYIKINTYLPVVLVVHCAMVAFGIWDRLLGMCMSSRFKFTTDDIDDEYTEKVRRAGGRWCTPPAYTHIII